jgi:GDP-4-dehydro-6-deoxy-D-mannose reductase
MGQSMLGNRALITGIQGFSGRHLCAHLVQEGYTVYGADLALDIPMDNVKTYLGDIRDPNFVQKVVDDTRPTVIFHLAALISPDASVEALCDVNVRGTEHLFSAMQRAGLDSVILIPGSSAAYGSVEQVHLPIRESQPFRPLTPYAVSKIAQEMLAYMYYARYGLKVVCTRAFNLVGPGQPHSFVGSAFAAQIAEIEIKRSEPVIRVGNLNPKRDFVDVRDAVRAYRLAVERGRPGEVYNVCSGQAVSIQTSLDTLLKLTQRPIRVEQDSARMRPSDILISVGDNSLLRQRTGWQPMIPLEQSLADLLDDWRRRIREA